MVGTNAPRTQIALPAQGVQELRDTLTSLLDEFGNEDDRGRTKRHLEDFHWKQRRFSLIFRQH